MAEVFIGGLVVSLLSLVLAGLFAYLVLLPRRSYEYWSPILSDRQLHHLGMVSAVIWLWPVTTIGVSLLMAGVFSQSRFVLMLPAEAIVVMVLGTAAMVDAIRQRRATASNVRLSEETRRWLEPKILAQWSRVGGRPEEVQIEVRAFKTRDGPQGSVIVRVVSGRQLSRDVAEHLAEPIPPYLKFRVEPRPL